MRGEALNKLCAASHVGSWRIDGPDDATCVVFDHDGERLAFLLNNWQARPAYTCMPLASMDVTAQYVGPAFLAARQFSSFCSSYATLGLLTTMDGTPVVSTLDGNGQPIRAAIAPWINDAKEDGEFAFQWSLVVATDEPGKWQVVHDALGTQSWLNEWKAPHWQPEEGEEDAGAGALVLSFGLSIPRSVCLE